MARSVNRYHSLALWLAIAMIVAAFALWLWFG
jgi:hypothetical protein